MSCRKRVAIYHATCQKVGCVWKYYIGWGPVSSDISFKINCFSGCAVYCIDSCLSQNLSNGSRLCLSEVYRVCDRRALFGNPKSFCLLGSNFFVTWFGVIFRLGTHTVVCFDRKRKRLCVLFSVKGVIPRALLQRSFKKPGSSSQPSMSCYFPACTRAYKKVTVKCCGWGWWRSISTVQVALVKIG